MLLDVSISFPNLGIEISDLPKSFSIFGFNIAFYGLIIGIGMFLAVMLVFKEAKITGQNTDDYLDLAIFGIVFAIIGARLYYVAFEWDNYKDNLMSIFNIRQGGLAIYGGVIGGVLAGYVVCKYKKMNFFQAGDAAALGLLVGQIIGRWGNFFNREAFGGNTDGLFAMKINVYDTYVTVRVPESVSYTDATHKWIQVQPTFLYESFGNLIILMLIMIFKKKKKYHGEVFMWYFLGYGALRFWIESMRTDQLIIKTLNYPVSQLLSAVLVVVMMVLIVGNRICLMKKGKTMFKFFKLVEAKPVQEKSIEAELVEAESIEAEAVEAKLEKDETAE